MPGIFSRAPLPPSQANLTAEEEHGYDAFWHSASLSDMTTDDQRRGWWYGHRRAYGRGVKASYAVGGREVDCPYAQFSGPWEAWCDGYNEEDEL
jgi:hypothetical protein